MSISSRISKLEHKHAAGYRIVCPMLFDANGNGFGQAPADDEVAMISFRCNNEHFDVLRNSNEDSDDFISRARAAAVAALNPTVMLHLRSDYI